METIKLYNGVEMPQIGYGVYQVDSKECERCVSDALSVGYGMIDTVQAYNNEEGVGDEDMSAIARLDTGKSLFFDHHDPETVKMFMNWR